MRILMVYLVCLSLLPLSAVGDPETVRVLWRKAPVPVRLKVGAERLVTFPEDVRVGVPAGLDGVLRTQSVAGVVYWRAEKPFPPHRIQVQGLMSGKVWLVDLSADEQAPTDPMEILDPALEKSQRQLSPDQGKTARRRPKPLGYVALTRLAARRLYAPKRLWRTPRGVRRVAVDRTPVPALIRLARIEAVPAASWRSGRITVTAVRLRNLEPFPVELDPRHLRGNWLAATFQHNRLQPAGEIGDETAVYLISNGPFEEAAP